MYNRKDGCKNNPRKQSTTKLSKHISSDFSMCTVYLFRSTENKHHVHRGEDCMTKFSELLGARNKIN